jgi:electron transport complex protein RnfB
MPGDQIYEAFSAWLRTAPMSLPDSEDVGELIRARYSREDAELLVNVPFDDRTIEELAEIKQMKVEELKPRLDALAKKGVVWKIFRNGANRYRLCDPFVVFYRSVYWGGGRNSEHYVMAPLLNKTFGETFEMFAHAHTRGLRTLPIEGVIEDTRAVMPFEDVLKVLDDQDFFCVGSCSCKAKHNLDPDHENCKHYPFEENCVHFGDFARYMVENGHGRELTREECRDVLMRCADVGLVHGVSNWALPVDTI